MEFPSQFDTGIFSIASRIKVPNHAGRLLTNKRAVLQAEGVLSIIQGVFPLVKLLCYVTDQKAYFTSHFNRVV